MVEYGFWSSMVYGRVWFVVEYGLWSSMVFGRVWFLVEYGRAYIITDKPQLHRYISLTIHKILGFIV